MNGYLTWAGFLTVAVPCLLAIIGGVFAIDRRAGSKASKQDTRDVEGRCADRYSELKNDIQRVDGKVDTILERLPGR